MARNAEDCALMLSVMGGDDVEDPLSFNVSGADYRLIPEIDLSSVRVAVSIDFGWAPVENGIRECFKARLSNNSKGSSSRKGSMPNFSSAPESLNSSPLTA